MMSRSARYRRGADRYFEGWLTDASLSCWHAVNWFWFARHEETLRKASTNAGSAGPTGLRRFRSEMNNLSGFLYHTARYVFLQGNQAITANRRNGGSGAQLLACSYALR